MYGAYSRVVELIGFAALVAAAVPNWRARSISLQVTSEAPTWIDVAELVDRHGRRPIPAVLDVRGRVQRRASSCRRRA
jgi:hypothetical protein